MSLKFKNKKELTLIIGVALLIVLVASVFLGSIIVEKSNEKSKREDIANKISQNTQKGLEDTKKQSDEIKKNFDNSLCGVYEAKGGVSLDDTPNSILTITLEKDGKGYITTSSSSDIIKAWWYSKKDDVGNVIVALGYDGAKDIVVYQKHGDYLFNTNTMFVGDINKGKETLLTFEDAMQKTIINLKTDSTCEVSYYTKDTSSELYGVEYREDGTYKTDGDIINISLNSSVSDYLIFSVNTDKEKITGIAPVFFKKQ